MSTGVQDARGERSWSRELDKAGIEPGSRGATGPVRDPIARWRDVTRSAGLRGGGGTKFFTFVCGLMRFRHWNSVTDSPGRGRMIFSRASGPLLFLKRTGGRSVKRERKS